MISLNPETYQPQRTIKRDWTDKGFYFTNYKNQKYQVNQETDYTKINNFKTYTQKSIFKNI